jgi:hypothetical protein
MTSFFREILDKLVQSRQNSIQAECPKLPDEIKVFIPDDASCSRSKFKNGLAAPPGVNIASFEGAR